MSIGTGAAIIGGSIIGGGISLIGAGKQADAAKQAGDAQAQAARDQVGLARDALNQQIQARASAVKEAGLSPDEIRSITQILQTQQQSLSASLQSIQKQQSALDAMAPTVGAAGQNLYDLLMGKSAAILQPLQQQQQMQRQKMMDQLSSQMGPGFMTSSAGIQALIQFDNQAALQTNQAQMQAIQTVGSQYFTAAGMQQQGQYGITSALGSAYGQAQQANAAALSGFQTGKEREIQAEAANPLNPFGVASAQGSVVQTAGAPFAGQAIAGQSLSQLGQGLAATGSAYGGMQMFGQLIAGKQAPSAGIPAAQTMQPITEGPAYNFGGK